ncbi:MAG TPA: hypothetical protein VHC49_00490, partial [Mycobacteriales bacterium]|nr:hypothetical protein [Mycobacteriales bacterium]
FAIRSIEIGGAVTLRIDDDRDLDVAALSTALDHPRKNAWTGIVVDNGSDWDHLYLWLAATRPGFCKFTTTSEAFAGGAVRPAMGWGGAAFHDGADFAYFTNRRANGQEPPYEIGIFAHGPNSQTLADDLAAQIRRWHRDFRSRTTARIEVHPKSTPPDRLDQAFVISKRHSTVALSFEPGTARSGYQTG